MEHMFYGMREGDDGADGPGGPDDFDDSGAGSGAGAGDGRGSGAGAGSGASGSGSGPSDADAGAPSSDGSVSVAVRLAGLIDRLADVPDSGLELLSDSAVLDAMLQAEQARRLLDALEGKLLVEADQRDVTDILYGLRTPGWLARQAQLPSPVSKVRVRVSVKLARFLPAAAEALAEGRIGFDHARVLADAANQRILEQFALAVPELIDQIAGTSFEKWKRDVQAFADLLDMDGGHDPSGDIERNRLSVKCVGDVTVIRGELVGEQAQIANRALNTIADELFDKFKRDNEITPELEIPDRATLMALALVEACRRGLAGSDGKAPRPEVALTLTPADLNHHHNCGCGGHGPGSGPAGATDPAGVNGPADANDPAGAASSGLTDSNSPAGAYGTGPGLNFDPISGPAGAFNPGKSSGSESAPGWGIGHPPRHLVEAAVSRLMSNMDTWRGMWVTDPDGMLLKESTWSTLLRDPDMYTLVIDSLGVPLDMGAKTRFATRAQRRALAARDGGCVFPGCGAPPQWCDAHHITEWIRLHETNLNGLLLLCRHHHGVAHRKGWNVRLDADGWTHWTTPNGKTFTGQRHQRTKPPP